LTPSRTASRPHRRKSISIIALSSEETYKLLRDLSVHFDIVICIDVTGSMASAIDLCKEHMRKLPHDLCDALAKKDKVIDTLRIRVIAFRDVANDSDALSASEFFVVEPSTDLARYESFVKSLSASGGGDEPGSALEALGIAQASDWTHEGDKQRHIIVMLTDASAHKLESRVGEIPSAFRDQVPASLDELTDRWEGGQTVRIRKTARRLLIFGPDAYPWNVLADTWGQTVWLQSQAGKGLEDIKYETILGSLKSSI